jgi:hypothetical protein
VHGRQFAASDIDVLYQTFEPISASVLLEHSDVIPGVASTLVDLGNPPDRIKTERFAPTGG